MSDNILSIIPVAPHRQPAAEAADAAMAVLRRLAPQLDGFVTTEYRITWHEQVAVVGCGANLERIECPVCRDMSSPRVLGLREPGANSENLCAACDVGK